MYNFKGMARLCSAVVVATMLAACSGHSGGLTPAPLGDSSVAQSHPAQSVQESPPRGDEVAPQSEDAKTKCGQDSKGKGISVKPCAVTFTLLDLNPVTVKVKAAKHASITESDNCASAGIAALSGGPTSWTVTPGLLPGTCTATFTAKVGSKKAESATLTVNNAN